MLLGAFAGVMCNIERVELVPYCAMKMMPPKPMKSSYCRQDRRLEQSVVPTFFWGWIVCICVAHIPLELLSVVHSAVVCLVQMNASVKKFVKVCMSFLQVNSTKNDASCRYFKRRVNLFVRCKVCKLQL